MTQNVTLDNKEVREIIAKFLGISVEQVVSLKYNFAITGLSAEEITKRMRGE